MGLLSLQMLLFFLKGIQLTVGQVTITTTPAVIESEITKSLVVTCRFPPQPSSGYQVFSLAIKKLLANSTLHQLASINRDSHTTVHLDAPSYGINRSNGVINSTLGSFLTLEWVNPMVSESGTYQCKANVFNEADDIFVFNENKSVSFTQPSVGSLTHLIFKLDSEVNNKLQRLENDFNNLTAQSTQTNNKLQKLENEFNNLTAQSTQTNNKLQKLENEFNNLTAQSTQTNNKLQKLETTLHNLESTIFKKSTVLNGHQYYLSLYEPYSAAMAEMACEALGGYLAEVDSKNELDFITIMIGNTDVKNMEFLLGGTDEGHEGIWINRHSGTPLGYTVWSQGEPSNGAHESLEITENCQVLEYLYSLKAFVMNDFFCFNILDPRGYYFICEVPL
ncbi:unnamed protein product [Lymnaea stagnalis]|uniref:C-type lectin domain-containing protein n=1 Tax=Lymnaea stagnalis TaxID=6523 RepID=A0AAV2HT28_LYMST